MVIAGALLAFEGLRELFMLVPPRLQEAASQAEEALAEAREKVEHGEGVRMLVRHAVVGLLVVGLIAGAIYFMRSPDALPRTPAFTDACNGDRALCGRPLDAVVFPAAHNSMSAAEFYGWMFPNQELGSVSLLDHGIRALLFDVHYGTPIGGRVKTDIQDEEASRAKFEKAVGKEAVDAAMRIRDRLTGPPTGPRAAYLCHGFCELGAVPLVTMLEGVRDFLVENPGEVLLFVIEDYVTPADVEAAFREAGLERFVYRGGVKPPFPTLRETDRLRPAPRRVRGERHHGRALVPPGLRDDPGDALLVPRAGGVLLPTQPRRDHGASLPDQPLDRDDADPEAVERRDRQRARLPARPCPPVPEGAREDPQHPRRGLRHDRRRGGGGRRAERPGRPGTGDGGGAERRTTTTGGFPGRRLETALGVTGLVIPRSLTWPCDEGSAVAPDSSGPGEPRSSE